MGLNFSEKFRIILLSESGCLIAHLIQLIRRINNLFTEAEVEQDFYLLEEETAIWVHTRKKKATHEDLFKGLKVEK